MSIIGCAATELDTPVLLIDQDQLSANIQRYASLAALAGVQLRPHIKTHKMPEIAAMQLAAGAHGITAAKLGEAETFAAAGIQDIFIAYPLVGQLKARRAARLAQNCHLIVGAESSIGIAQLSDAAREAGVTLFIRIEIDTGLKRTGVPPAQAEALCRQVMAAPDVELDGLFTFRGTSFPGASTSDPQVLGEHEGKIMVVLAEQLRASGIPLQTVSVGSTPTTPSAALVPGVTEVRPGTYVFFDRMTTHAGTSTAEEIALSILATVISRPASDIAIIDAGSKTFCGDIIPANVGLQGYGITTDGRSGIVERMSEEHGIVRLTPGCNPQIGEKMLFFPNHVCTTVNLSDEVVLVQKGLVKAIWSVAARGQRQ